MKIFFFSICLMLASLLNAQSLPFDFESDIVESDFTNFDGGTASVIPNPQINGINTSETVGQIVRNGGTIWAGSKVLLDANLDLSTDGNFTMKIFSTAPIGTIMKLKLEGPGTPVEIDIPSTVTGEWEEITWNFTGLPGIYNCIVFMFDFGNIGDGSSLSTFWFDDVRQGPALESLGCTYPEACNYDSSALVDDGSCFYTCYGCMDELALNYDPEATVADDSCVPDPGPGCLGDFNGDGVISSFDLSQFLGIFGTSCVD